MTIENVYSIHRAVESSNFTHAMDNKQLLFHSSQVKNFVGILSRLDQHQPDNIYYYYYYLLLLLLLFVVVFAEDSYSLR